MSNPKKQYGDRKVKMQLVPPSAMIAIANALTEGAEKYGPYNWREDDVEAMTYIGAIYRHLAAWIEFEDADPDGNGKTHLEGAIASLAILIDAQEAGTLIDNRPNVPAPGVLDSLRQGARLDDEELEEPEGVKEDRNRMWDEVVKRMDSGARLDEEGYERVRKPSLLIDEDGNETNLAIAVDHRQDQARAASVEFTPEEQTRILRGW